jgi:hypothetical protein
MKLIFILVSSLSIISNSSTRVYTLDAIAELESSGVRITDASVVEIPIAELQIDNYQNIVESDLFEGDIETSINNQPAMIMEPESVFRRDQWGNIMLGALVSIMLITGIVGLGVGLSHH